VKIKLAFVAYAVSDVLRARAFYTDVLGLAPGESFGEGFVEFDLGNATFAIDADPPGTAPGTCSGVSFEFDDVFTERARLAERGVEITDVMESSVCWFAFATDPDGNSFQIHQRKRAPSRRWPRREYR
jgi:predicted enzyme related to lactoylglutathione lyase